MALVLNILSEQKHLDMRSGQSAVVEGGLERALELLGNLARDREGRKCISRQSSWQVVLSSALTNIQDAIIDTDANAAAAVAAAAAAGSKASLPSTASDCMRHALALLCRL